MILCNFVILGEVFGCILSLFMGDGDQLLPTDEEVIVCDENTTAEEVNSIKFMRMAVKVPTKKYNSVNI